MIVVSDNSFQEYMGNFRGAYHFWGDPYVNSTTVLYCLILQPNSLAVYAVMAIMLEFW